MAIFRAGPLLDAISGDVGGINFTRSRHGPIMRRKLTRTNKRTPIQLERRARFYHLKREWNLLTTSQRTAWRSSAAQLTFPNRLGVPNRITGHQLFFKVNLAAPDATTTATDPPENLVAYSPPPSIEVIAQEDFAITCLWEQPTYSVAPTTYFYGARSLSSRPKHFFNYWRFVTSVQEPAGTNVINFTAAWTAALGSLLGNELIKVKVKFFDPAFLPSTYTYDTIVTTPPPP